MLQIAKKTAPMPPRVNVDPRVGTLVGGATTPSEITAAMLATLAGTSRLSEQRRVLQQLTEKVEEQKRAIQLQMQMKQQADILAVGDVAIAQPTQATISEPSYAKVEEQKRAIEQLMEMNQHATIQAVGSVAIAQPTQATIPEPGIANVEEQKRAMEQLMEMKQHAMIPVVGGLTIAPSTRATISLPSHAERMAATVETRDVSEPTPIQSIPLPAVTSYVPPPKPKSASSLAAKAHVATVDPIVVEKPQPAFSLQTALDAQHSKPPLPAIDKKIRDPVPNVARKRLSKKIATAPVIATPVVTKPVVPSVLTNTAFSGNLSLLPASVQLLLTSGSQQTVDSDESQPDTTEDSGTTGVEVKSPDDGNAPDNEMMPRDEVHAEKDVPKVTEFNTGNNPGVNDENVLKLVEKALAAIGSSGNVVAADKTAAVPEPKKEESQPCESELTESNPHGDVDYRIAPAGGFPPLSQLPLVPAPQLPRQPAFWAKPDESTIRSPGATAGPGSIPGFEPDEPAFTAAPTQKQPGWDPFAPNTKPLSEPVFPTGPVVVSQPPDARQTASEEPATNMPFPPNAGHAGEAPPRMWNPPPPPPVRPWGGVRPPVRFGSSMPRAPPPVFVAPQPPPPKTANVAPVPSGDIDERIQASFLPGSRGHPWQPPAVRPPIVPPPPLPETAKPAVVPTIKPAVVVPTMDLSALGKFAVEFLKEQKQKGQVGTQPSGTGSEAPGTGMPPPALQTAQGQSDKLPDAVPPVKAIDADERCSSDNVQLGHQVVGRTPTQQKGHDARGMHPPALQTVREQTHKLPGTVPPVKAIDTDDRRSADNVQLSHQVVGRTPTQQKGRDARGMHPPALQTVREQTHKLPGTVPPVKAIDTDERHSHDNVQLSHQDVGRSPTQQKGHDALVMPHPALQIQTVREQTHKLPGAIPPIKAIDTDERRSKDTVQLSHQVVGRIPTQQKGHDALGMPHPALQIETVRERTHKLPDAVPRVKAIDTDDRRSSDNVHHVAGSAEKSIDMSSQSQESSRKPPLLVQDNVTSVSQQHDGLEKGNTSLAEDDSRWDAFAKCVQKKDELSMQVKEKVIVIDEKTNLVSEKKTKAKSGVIDLTELCRVTTKNRESGVTGKAPSKWVPMGAAVAKPPNVAAVSAVKVQQLADKASAPTTDKRSPKAAKVARVQLKPLGKSLIETKMPQLLDPVEAKPVLSSLAEIKLAQQSSSEVPVPVSVPKVKKLKGQTLPDVQSKAQVPDKIKSKDESPLAKDNILVKHSPRSKSKRDASSVPERVSSKKAKAKKSVDKPRSRSSSSKSSGARHRTRSRSRERLKKERRRSRSREKRSESHRDRKRSTSKSRGRNQRATKRGSRSRSRDRDAKHARSRDGGAKRRSRDRDVKRRSRSRSRDRDVKRRSRSRSRDRDVKRRSRSRSRDREAKWKSRSDSRERRESERDRDERRLEIVGRRSSPDIQNIETVSRDDRGDNDERIRYGHSRDVDQRTAEHGDRDERYMQNIPSVTGQTGGADADAQKSFEKSLLEGGRDTDERVPARTSVLTLPFVSGATEPWTEQTPPGDASGDTDDREPWRHHGDRDLFAEPQPRFDPAAPRPNVQPHNDPRTSHNDPRMPPVTFTHPPPVNQMVPPHPSAWVPRMTGPRPPFFPPPIGLPERQPFRPRGPGRGWPRGGRPGPW